MVSAIENIDENMDEWAVVDELQKLSRVAIPAAVEDIKTAPVCHNLECDVDQMENTVADILKM